MFSGKTFMVTGATGRLGCSTVKRLEDLGAEVIPVVLGEYPLKPKRIKWDASSSPIKIEGKRDLNKLRSPDYVINFHWQVNRTLSFSEQLRFEVDNNINQLSYLWNWLKKRDFDRFVNISTIKIFSHYNKSPVSADDDPYPIFPYGIAKVTAEKFFNAYFTNPPIPIVHLRLCSVASYGEHSSHLMSQLYKSAFEKRNITINTGHKVHIIYLDEAVDFIINATLKGKHGRYIITKDSILTDHVAKKFEKISGKKIHADYIDLEPEKTEPEFNSDVDKLSEQWIRRVSLETAIERIIEFNKQS